MSADSWARAVASANKAIRILRARPEYRNEPYIDERNMPANWTELGQKVKNLWAAVNAKPRKKEMAIDKSKIRGELVRLKTDIERSFEHDCDYSNDSPAIEQCKQQYQITLEEDFYRTAIETTMGHMEKCDLGNTLRHLLVVENSHRFIARYDSMRRIPKIEDLLIDTLVEIANNNCKCQFKEE